MEREHRTVIGIDPGMDGAIAVLRRDQPAEVFDMPTVTLEKTAGGNKRQIELKTLWEILDNQKHGAWAHMPPTLVVIELIQPMPSGTGAPCKLCKRPLPVKGMPRHGTIGAMSLGKSSGILEMAATALGVPFIRILPTTWKRRFSLLGQGKQASRVRAMERFPTVDLSKKKHDGRADALWLALYGMEVER